MEAASSNSKLERQGQRRRHCLDGTLLLLPGRQVDKALLAGNRNSATGEEIPAAEPGAERDYLYLDT